MKLYRRKAFQKIEKKFAEEQGLPFVKLLGKNLIEKVVKEENIKYRNRIFTPTITLWALHY